MKFKSLRFRINTAILATCVIIVISFGAVLYPFESKTRQSRMANIKLLLAAVFNQKKEQIANEIFSKQIDALTLSLKEIQSIENISMLCAYDIDGQIVVSTDTARLKKNLSDNERQLLEIKPIFSQKVIDGKTYARYTSIIEIIGERVGYINIFYDLTELEKESFLVVVFFFMLLFLVLLSIIALLNIFLYSAVIDPVSKLRDAITKLQTGQLGLKVDLSSTDEIGQMGIAFNEMSAKLKDQHIDLTSAIKTKESYAVKLEETNKELADLNAKLEDMVEERTSELRKSNKQLQQEIIERQRAYKEKKELEERLARSQKMEALGLLAGGVAHDLNNVLSGMVSYPDLLLMDMPEDNPMHKAILTIKQSGLKAAAIVQDLLTLARRGVLSTEVLNLNDLVSEYLMSPEHHKIMSFHRSIDIEVALEEDLMNIRGSSVHLKKTIMNLITNASEAQPEGGKIVITTCNQYVDRPIKGYDNVKEGDYAVLEILDHGTGISPSDIERIFEPFYTKKVMGRSGTGLGMAVVWGTVQDHFGYINIDSTEGKGSKFELYFPVTREEIKKQAEKVPIQEFAGQGQKVLIIDDVPEQIEIATSILKKLGYMVDAVSSGEKAVEYLHQKSVDILVLDMIMDPGMDGLETYQKILEIHPGQKAIIASGFAENERVRQAQRLGAGAYVKKPYMLEKIGLALKAELNKT